MDNPYAWLQEIISEVPELLQPLLVALTAAIPYVEGEGAAALGIIVGINPIIAGLAAIAGNVLCVVIVVLLGSRIRGSVIDRRTARAESVAVAPRGSSSDVATSTIRTTATADPVIADVAPTRATSTSRSSKGRAKLGRWMVRFGVPGASILAPIALPTMLTAAFFVASGVRKEWVMLWQVVAITLWTGAVAIAATGVLALIGW